MNILKMNKPLTLVVLLVIIISILPSVIIFSKADTSAGYSLEAALYDTNQYSGSTGTKLTEEGASVTGWDYRKSKYLQIDPVVPADGNTYKISVELPQQFYIVASKLSVPAGYETVDFTKNNPIKINSSTTYALNTYSGKAEYIMKNMGVSGTIQIEIAYDAVLWDKQEGSLLTPDGVYPIVITLIKEDTDGNVTELKKLSLKSATAGSKLTDAFATFTSVDGASSTSVYKDKTVDFGITINDNDNTARYKYYPTASISITLPSYTDSNGKKHYLVPTDENIKFPKVYYSSKEIDKSKLETNGIIVVNFKDIYFKTSTIVSIKAGPLSDELIAMGNAKYRFTGAQVVLTADALNGNTNIKYINMTTSVIDYVTVIDEKVSITKSTPNISIIERPEGAVSTIGCFGIKNTGTGDSCAKTINMVFDTQDTKLIKVTTINTNADITQEYIPIKYTLVDENGDKVYLDSEGNRVEATAEGAISEWTYSMKNALYKSTKAPNNYNNKFSRSMLPENQREYYFKSIEYTIDTVPALSELFAKSSQMAFTSGGNFYGYVSDKAVNNDKVVCTMTIKSSNSDIPDLVSSLTTTLQATSIPSYVLESVALGKSAIQAGESVGLTGKIAVATYPYNNCTWLKGITLALILPSEVVINEQSITAKTAAGKSITGLSITSKSAGNNTKLWVITFPSDVCIGYLTEERGSLPSGTSISFSLQLDTAYTMNELTLFAKDIIMVAGYMQVNGAGGSYNWSRLTDTYDLNYNGSYTDTIAKPTSLNTSSCQISAQSATLSINDTLSVERDGTITTESDTQSLYSKDDIINYNLDISCESGGSASSFSYYIPINKKSSAVDNFLIDSTKNGNFEMELQGPVSVSGNDLFTYRYSFEKGLTYTEIKESSDWYTAEQIESDENKKWEDVTAIKILSKATRIENGNFERTAIKLKYKGSNYEVEAGYTNKWHSGGYYHYENGDRESAGNIATDGVSLDLKYVIELPAVTLTAAKDMTPEQYGNTNTITVSKSNFPQFLNAQNFSVTNVETYNAVLENSQYIIDNVNMTSTEANRTFAITAAINGQAAKDVLSTASTTPIVLGDMPANDSPELTFKLYNANALTDNTQNRYLNLTITGNNGVIIKQRINIDREIVQASDPKSSIVSGKRYMIFDDVNTETTISQDSAFTSQFIVTYIPDVYKEQRLVFSNELPVGTNIILANLTSMAESNYCYYNVTTPTKVVKLEEFIAMGSSSNLKYQPTSGGTITEEKILTIVDFSNCDSNTLLAEGTYSIKMESTGINSSIEDFASDELKFKTKLKRGFTFNHPTSIVANESFEISYSMTESLGGDSKYDGRSLALVLTADDNIPADARVIVNETEYYLNTKRQFIIPLKDMLTTSYKLNLVIYSQLLPEKATSYNINLSFWVSATANANAPLLGERVYNKDITLTAKGNQNSALKPIALDERIIASSKLASNHSLTYSYVKGTDCYVTVELQKKSGIAYQKVTDKLNQVNNSINHTMGVFNISPIAGTNTVNFKLSSVTEPGTYRIVFKVYDKEDKKIYDIPYNFIIKR